MSRAMASNVSESAVPTISSDDPGVTELFALLAYGEISAFERLSADAAKAPDLRGRVAMASMAAAEMGHYERLHEALERRGADVYQAMEPYVQSLEDYHASTNPSTWLESLVKAYIGDGLAADFYREIAGTLSGEVAEIVREVLSETAHSTFVVDEVNKAVSASPQAKARLTLWGRRLLGEAVTQAQYVAARREELSDLVLAAVGDINHLVELFDRLQEQHAVRMAALGLV